MHKSIIALAAAAAVVIGGSATLASAATTPTIARQPFSNADPLNGHAGQPGGPLSSTPGGDPASASNPTNLQPGFNPKGVHPNGVTVNGKICLNGNGDPVTGGNCWWESAVQLWYNMKNGVNEQSELATIYSEYGGDFQDGWTDDNAWWGITFQLGNQLYGVANYLTKADNLWTYDTTSPAWNSECGGSDIQHSGGAQDDIARASLGELAHALGKSGSADNAATWIFAHMQNSTETAPADEGLNTNSPSPCTVSGSAAQLGGQAESWKVDDIGATGDGVTGTKNSAIAQHPDSDFNGIFNELYDVYGL